MTLAVNTTTILAVTGLIRLLSEQVTILIKENATLRGIDPDDIDVEELLKIQQLLLEAAKTRNELLDLLKKEEAPQEGANS